MHRSIGLFLVLVCFGLVSALTPALAGAATRGISVELRASETPGAPVTETVRLYEKSYALIIGIDRYTRGWPRLHNAVRDAKAVAVELEARGFEVRLETKLDGGAFREVLREFFALKGEQADVIAVGLKFEAPQWMI